MLTIAVRFLRCQSMFAAWQHLENHTTVTSIVKQLQPCGAQSQIAFDISDVCSRQHAQLPTLVHAKADVTL